MSYEHLNRVDSSERHVSFNPMIHKGSGSLQEAPEPRHHVSYVRSTIYSFKEKAKKRPKARSCNCCCCVYILLGLLFIFVAITLCLYFEYFQSMREPRFDAFYFCIDSFKEKTNEYEEIFFVANGSLNLESKNRLTMDAVLQQTNFKLSFQDWENNTVN